MALARDPLPHDSCIRSKVQGCAFSGAAFGGSSESAPHHGSQTQLLDAEDSSESSNGVSKTSGATTLSSCLTKGSINYQPEEARSVIHFKAGSYDSVVLDASESLFSFQQSSFVNNYTNSNDMKINNQKEHHCVWGNDLDSGYQWNQLQLGPKYTVEPRLQQDFSCFQTASSYCSIGYKAKENPPDPWLYSESTIVADTPRELEANEQVLHKRPSTEESMQAQKKQCNSNASKKQKPKSTPSMDPQSIAAKNRRERISERLKILQELVPNGSKVDLVTMLEKAIGYVKFLQLQVKVLATDEFWPAQGGKAPDISQVKEAIDAILASHKDRNSTSE